MDVFDKAMEYVLANEGGYGWDPDDAGGPTNFGITQHDLSAWREKPVSPDDVKYMTVDEAKHIYFFRYWTPLGCSEVKPVAIAACIMDTGVLYGVHKSGVFTQTALNGLGSNLKVDGQIGPNTIIELNRVDVKAFIEAFVDLILKRIDDIIESRPRNAKFRGGWTTRAKRLLSLA